jgi:hypothetical protein
MKRKKLSRLLTLSICVLFPLYLFPQECTNYYKMGDCRMDLKRGYKMYSQSQNAMISPLDTLEFNIIFYGQKEYIISFCTHAKFYPVNFRLLDPNTREILYDNAQDKYIESLGIDFDATKPLILQINVIARDATPEEIECHVGCVGLLIQYRQYPKASVNLQM